MAVPENKRVSLERSFIPGRCPALHEESGTGETRNFRPSPASPQFDASRRRTLLKLCDETKLHTERWLPALLSLWFSWVWGRNNSMLHMQIESNIFHFANKQSFGFLLDFLPFSLFWIVLCSSLHEYRIFRRARKPSLDVAYIAKNILQQCQLCYESALEKRPLHCRPAHWTDCAQEEDPETPPELPSPLGLLKLSPRK